MIIGSLQPVTKYMLIDNSNYCFLNHSHELITLKFVIPACIGVFVAPSRVVARLGCRILVLRVNLSGFTCKSTWFDPPITTSQTTTYCSHRKHRDVLQSTIHNYRIRPD